VLDIAVHDFTLCIMFLVKTVVFKQLEEVKVLPKQLYLDSLSFSSSLRSHGVRKSRRIWRKNDTSSQAAKHPSIQAAKHPSIRVAKTGIHASKHPVSQASEHPSIQSAKHPGIQASNQPSIRASNIGIRASTHPVIHASEHPGSQLRHPRIQVAKHPVSRVSSIRASKHLGQHQVG